jgi:hypothetical protein
MAIGFGFKRKDCRKTQPFVPGFSALRFVAVTSSFVRDKFDAGCLSDV